MAWVLNFILTFLPSMTRVLVWRLGFQTFGVRRKEKLTLWPYCLPLPVKSHFCISTVYCICFHLKSQQALSLDDTVRFLVYWV